MKTRFATFALAAFALSLIALPVRAQDASEEVVVYTNADLERMFGPAEPAPTDESDPYDGEGWEFVRAFIADQHERIEANRDHALEQARVRNEAEALRPRRERLVFPFGGYPEVLLGFPWIVPTTEPASIGPPETLVPELNPLIPQPGAPDIHADTGPPRTVRNSARAAARRNGRPAERR